MKRILVLVFGVWVVAGMCPTDLNGWNAFKLKYSKQYHNETEEKIRMEIFHQNKKLIAEHNKLHDMGLVLYRMGVNKYSDITDDEFDTMKDFNSASRSFRYEDDDCEYFRGSHYHQYFHDHDDDLETLPHSIDWREKGAVTDVKSQGHCGACWTFTATGAIEAQHFRKTGELVSLSEQNLLDCVGHGCHGGYKKHAFEYAMNNGIATEDSYPYTAEHGITDGICKSNADGQLVTISGMKCIPENDENLLQEAIATIGPVSVSIDTARHKLKHYVSGIFHDPYCDTQSHNHAVLVVGYGTDDNDNEYYICKNSWGKHWGEDGYFRLARNRENQCGVATNAIVPIID